MLTPPSNASGLTRSSPLSSTEAELPGELLAHITPLSPPVAAKVRENVFGRPGVRTTVASISSSRSRGSARIAAGVRGSSQGGDEARVNWVAQTSSLPLAGSSAAQTTQLCPLASVERSLSFSSIAVDVSWNSEAVERS